MKKPDIPKALASRICGAQDKLAACIEAHAWAEKGIPEIEAKLAAFDRDPDLWAQTNYPGKDKDSYPVQTHISRARDSLARKIGRRPREMQDIREAQENLARVEQEVLEKLESMRATDGRVPWPKPIRSVEQAMRDLERDVARWKADAEKEKRKREEQYARDEAREAAKKEAENNAAIRAHVAKGPEHVLRHFSESRAVREALDEYKETNEYRAQTAIPGNWAGPLISFVSSSMASEAASRGRRFAEGEITHALANGEDLWDACRRLGFHSPDSVAALDRGEKVPLS